MWQDPTGSLLSYFQILLGGKTAQEMLKKKKKKQNLAGAEEGQVERLSLADCSLYKTQSQYMIHEIWSLVII